MKFRISPFSNCLPPSLRASRLLTSYGLGHRVQAPACGSWNLAFIALIWCIPKMDQAITGLPREPRRHCCARRSCPIDAAVKRGRQPTGSILIVVPWWRTWIPTPGSRVVGDLVQIVGHMFACRARHLGLPYGYIKGKEGRWDISLCSCSSHRSCSQPSSLC